MFKVNNKDNRTMHHTRTTCRSGIFIVNFEENFTSLLSPTQDFRQIRSTTN